jgi:serine/threonine protein kinase
MSLVADMHELTLIHTDLKPENILLVSSEYIRVPDYKVSSYNAVSSIACFLLSRRDFKYSSFLILRTMNADVLPLGNKI